jgi:Cdc6-like AAA superfamily ATPase
MSLADLPRGVFASVTTAVDLVERYVGSAELAGMQGDDRPETQIMRALCDGAPGQRVHVYGDGGQGKTSLILRVLADIGRRELPRPPHALVLNTGDEPSKLGSPTSFMRLVLGMIKVNGYRFETVDPVLLRDALSEGEAHTPAIVTHHAGISAPVLSYQAQLTEAFKVATFGTDSPQVRNDFQDVVREVARDYRPIIVIDDTDHFATADGLDEDAISNLYHHGIRTLCELHDPPLDVVVALQRAFRGVANVADVEERFGFLAVEAPQLPAHHDVALNHILARRLIAAEVKTPLEDLVTSEAVAQLQGAYFIHKHDLRWVLDRAQRALELARDENAERVAPRHVQRVLNTDR